MFLELASYQGLKVRIIQPLPFDFNFYFPFSLYETAILNPYRVPVITYLHTNSSKTPRIIREAFCYLEAFCFHFCLVFVPWVRKMKRMRAEDKEQTGDSEVWSVCEPGNTSLNRRWALSQPFSTDKTHSTKQGQHCSMVAPKEHMAELVKEWCQRQHNKLWSTFLNVLYGSK